MQFPKLRLVQKPKQKPVYSQGKFDPKHPLVTQSWLTLHEACAFAAFMRYIEGKEDPPNGYATIGLSVDAGITHGADTVIRTGKDAPLSEKLEVAAATFDRLAPRTRFFKDLIKPNCRAETLALVALHHKEFAPNLKPVATSVAIKSDFENYSIAGKLDVIEEGNFIGDYKTTRNSGKHQVELSAQPALYSLLFLLKYGILPAGFRFYVLLRQKKPKIELVPGKVRPQDHEVLRYRIRIAIAEMQASLKSGDWRLAEQGHWRCSKSGRYCVYLNRGCPKGKRIFKGEK